jgi:TPP-dependent 2-oxoacid decarboxylase
LANDHAAENVDGLSWVACANELNAAVEAILARLQVAGRAHAMVTQLVTRYGVRELASELIANANLPVFTTPNDIGNPRCVDAAVHRHGLRRSVVIAGAAWFCC